MTLVSIRNQVYDVDLVVFDKDGLLFDSQYFWKKLAEIRIAHIAKLLTAEQIKEWCDLFGIGLVDGNIKFTDPNGIFALASPKEEIVVLATLLKKYKGYDWGVCREISTAIFKESDQAFNLIDSLQPKPGFPEIFQKLRSASIPYGIATSDDFTRTKLSVQHFDDFEYVRFVITPEDVDRGKPNPDMLELAVKKTGVRAGRIMMVGDSFVDMLMANKAGCIGVGVPDDQMMKEKMKPYANVIIDSLYEIHIQ